MGVDDQFCWPQIAGVLVYDYLLYEYPPYTIAVQNPGNLLWFVCLQRCARVLRKVGCLPI